MTTRPTERSIRQAVSELQALLDPFAFDVGLPAEPAAERLQQWADACAVYGEPKLCLDASLTGRDDIKMMVFGFLDMIRANVEQELYNIDAYREGPLGKGTKISGFEAIHSAVDMLEQSLRVAQQYPSRNSERTLQCYRDVLERRFPSAPSRLLDLLATSIVKRAKGLYNMRQEKHGLYDIKERCRCGTISPDYDSGDRYEGDKGDKGDKVDKVDKGDKVDKADDCDDEVNDDADYEYPPGPRPQPRSFPFSFIVSYCPICATQLKIAPLTETIKDSYKYARCARLVRIIWLTKENRSHIDDDIYPYICISSDCGEEVISFPTFQDWRYHMQVAHDRDWSQKTFTEKWYCEAGHVRANFDYSENLKSHLLNRHHSQMRDDQLQRILKTNVFQEPRGTFVCPLCNSVPESIRPGITEDPYELLWAHIAEHLKSVGLMSISYLGLQDGAGSLSCVCDGHRGSLVVNASIGSEGEEEEFTLPPRPPFNLPVFPITDCSTIPEDTRHKCGEPDSSYWDFVPMKSFPEPDETLARLASCVDPSSPKLPDMANTDLSDTSQGWCSEGQAQTKSSSAAVNEQD